jgi:peptidyl-prolyl cis-trans isomerase B (cyclophilin B)
MKNLKLGLNLLIGLAAVALSLPLASPASAQTNPPAAAPKAPAGDKEVAVIKTTEGDMVIEFWDDAATNTVANFKKLAKSGFYDDITFHRIVDGFMIQGGDPGTKAGGKLEDAGGGGPGYRINDEKNSHHHERGTIAMANSGPNSAGSQFYICLAPQPNLDANNYTTFGHLIKGDDVLGKIGKTPVAPNPHNPREISLPTKRVTITSVKIVPASSIK